MKYKTNELAKVLGVTTNTIRRYENNGYITPDKSIESGYRSYTQGDILKIGLIRLLRKCGFTHQEIESFNNKPNEEIRDLAQNKLDAIDRQIQRLKFLRHWLKDNIQMIDVCRDLGEGFTVMECPPVYYVLYSSGEKLLTEKERLKTITDFMYAAPEVQSIMLYREKDLKNGNVLPNLGWAIKEMDIERIGLQDIFANGKY
ncbi:MAG: MerR family transcriptional regulator, partial [Firmicutes bacterium]|nr:MerR family transcriptional regulator [Bacillota bacterium]